MNMKAFFEKFEMFADAPNAVVKMRELVLDLAVKGKLTDRDLKKESVSSKYSDEPNSDDLPANWRLLNFGKFCDIQGGNQPPKSQFSDEPRQGYVRMFQIRDLGERPVPVYISKESTNRFCREGEILIGRYGASVGKVFWAQDGAYNVALAKFIFPEDALLPPFAFWVLKSDFFQAEIAGASRSAQAGFNKGDLAAIDFPLPPLAEQKRIVAKVDELMALCDRLEAQQQEREEKHKALSRASLARFADAPTPGNLNFIFHPSYTIAPADLRKAILTLAVQGKLVPQDPNDEPAETLVARVAAEKRRLVQVKEIKTETPLDPISDEEVFLIPHTWMWLRAGELCRPISSGSTPDQSVFHASYGVPYLKVYNIRNQAVDFDYKRQFIAVNHHEERMKRSILRPGDVIMNIVGPPLGKVAIVPATFPEWNCNQAISFFRPIFPEFATYLYTFLKEGSFLQNIQLIGTAGQDNISVTKCKFIPVPIPPLAEQRRIVAKVDELMKLVDALETQLAASRATAANLLAAIVAELTGTPNTGKVSVPTNTTTGTGTGRRGRPPKS